MPDPQHVETVRAGAGAIARWRAAHPDTELDLRGADLRGVNLSNADLTGAALSRASLTDADLSHANLEKADLGRAALSGANLSCGQPHQRQPLLGRSQGRQPRRTRWCVTAA